MWNKLKYHGLQGAKKIRGSYLCVPLSFLAEATGAGYESEEDGAVVILKLKDGRRLQFARGSIGCVIDNTVRSMYCEALWRGKNCLFQWNGLQNIYAIFSCRPVMGWCMLRITLRIYLPIWSILSKICLREKLYRKTLKS